MCKVGGDRDRERIDVVNELHEVHLGYCMERASEGTRERKQVDPLGGH